MPDAEVEEAVRLVGKDVDLVVTTSPPLVGKVITAVECKDHGRRLSREAVATILSDYRPIIEQGRASKFLLVTRHGLVANARAMFDDVKFEHLTIDELSDQILRPARMLRSYVEGFEADLALYYEPARCWQLDLAFTASAFDKVYSDFVRFAAGSRISDLKLATGEWTRLTAGMIEAAQPAAYTPKLFERCLKVFETSKSADLGAVVREWVDADASIPQSLALIGSYGTGKSSFARWLAHLLAKSYLEGPSGRLPILIELRNFGGYQDIESLFATEVIGRYGLSTWTIDTVWRLNRNGQLVVILDGFDEMKQGLSLDALRFNFDQINRLSVSGARVILCGRPSAFVSDDEQALVLSGRMPSTAPAQYIPLSLAPFEPETAVRVLKRYVSSRRGSPRVTDDIDQSFAKLKLLMRDDAETRSVMSRPVHLPMIAEILPDLASEGGLKGGLSRIDVYRRFVDKLLTREAMRSRRERPSVADLTWFIEELSLLMLGFGDSRSIRVADIPDELVEALTDRGSTLDETRMLLVASSLVDRKHPDILYFPHKSFAEFLAACALVRRLAAEVPTADISGAATSSDVLSFVAEIASTGERRKALENLEFNSGIVEGLLALEDPELCGLVSTDGLLALGLADSLVRMPKLLAFRVLSLWRSDALSLPSDSKKLVGERCRNLSSLADGVIRELAQDVAEMLSDERPSSGGAGAAIRNPPSSSKDPVALGYPMGDQSDALIRPRSVGPTSAVRSASFEPVPASPVSRVRRRPGAVSSQVCDTCFLRLPRTLFVRSSLTCEDCVG